jgi:hypothetical protein
LLDKYGLIVVQIDFLPLGVDLDTGSVKILLHSEENVIKVLAWVGP